MIIVSLGDVGLYDLIRYSRIEAESGIALYNHKVAIQERVDTFMLRAFPPIPDYMPREDTRKKCHHMHLIPGNPKGPRKGK